MKILLFIGHSWTYFLINLSRLVVCIHRFSVLVRGTYWKQWWENWGILLYIFGILHHFLWQEHQIIYSYLEYFQRGGNTRHLSVCMCLSLSVSLCGSHQIVSIKCTRNFENFLQMIIILYYLFNTILCKCQHVLLWTWTYRGQFFLLLEDRILSCVNCVNYSNLCSSSQRILVAARILLNQL